MDGFIVMCCSDPEISSTKVRYQYDIPVLDKYVAVLLGRENDSDGQICMVASGDGEEGRSLQRAPTRFSTSMAIPNQAAYK
jgi:hypothetical protein